MTYKVTLIDKKFRKNTTRYVSQCVLATFTVLVTLIFLDVLSETAIITALGASAFIIFTMPNMYSSEPRRLIGGYMVGLSVGFIFYLLSIHSQGSLLFINQQTTFVVFGAMAVGISTFIMTITNTEHAPAAGIALGLVINRWEFTTILFIIGAVLWMAGVKRLLKPNLMDLTSPS